MRLKIKKDALYVTIVYAEAYFVFFFSSLINSVFNLKFVLDLTGECRTHKDHQRTSKTSSVAELDIELITNS
ncbi:hypothetical protein HOLleu_21754 [Holothuria leucospilota]|uniref:Uncharacterized protein n=1 Tax=Holothuria leucospilota TaxID=206669 RepID=A0A9Q1BYF2_HOLLE|nr:hypothetical protein HOLleu_21754 [Holothuria leucospilota]